MGDPKQQGGRFLARPPVLPSLSATSCQRIGGFFVLSTLLPTTPPRSPPTAAPINPPFTLSRLVVAPITAPAAAPIAASRCVCLTTTSPLAVVVVPELLLPLEVDRRRGALAVVRRVVVGAGVRSAAAFAAAALFASRAETLSRWLCCC